MTCILKWFLLIVTKDFCFSIYTLVLWFYDQVWRSALWKIKNGSYFLNHDMLIQTLIGEAWDIALSGWMISEWRYLQVMPWQCYGYHSDTQGFEFIEQPEKSITIPKQTTLYLEFVISSTNTILSLTDAKKTKTEELSKDILSCKSRDVNLTQRQKDSSCSFHFISVTHSDPMAGDKIPKNF